MAFEDFTTATKVDPNNRYTIALNIITVNDLSRDEAAYIYWDKGIDFFDGNYTHLIQHRIAHTSSLASTVYTWMLANKVGGGRTIDQTVPVLGSHSLELKENGEQANFFLYERVAGGSLFTERFDGFVNTQYYSKIVRDESIGTFGTLYCYIYTDSERTVLVGTLSIPLHEKMDFRYVYAANSYDASTSKAYDGTIENLDLGLGEEVGVVIFRRRMEDY